MMTGPRFVDGHSRDDQQAWWAARKAKYPFRADAPTSVKPTIVPGDHASVVLKAGWRTFGFRTDSERVTFCMQFGGRPVE